MLLSIVNNIFYVYMLHIYNDILYGIKQNRRVLVLIGWGIVATLFTLQKTVNVSVPILNMCLCSIPYMIVTFVGYESTIKRCVLYTIFYCIITVLSELISYMALGMFFDLTELEKFKFLMEISSNLCFFIVLRIFVLFSTKERYEINISDCISVFFIPFGSIVLLLEFCNPFSDVSYQKILIAVIILLAFNIFSYYFYVKMQENIKLKYKTVFLEKKNSDYIIESKKIANLWERISQFQHDLKYFSEMDQMRYSSFIEAYGFKNIVSQSGCIMIDAIVNSKATYAQQLGIEFEANVHIATDMDYMLEDVSIILYNLIDNAIEANKNNKGKKYIKLMINSDLRNENTLFIRIINPYEHIIKRNGKGEYITTKEDKYSHGYGLKSIGQFVEKHKGKMAINESNNEFDIRIILFDICNEPKLLN